MATTPTSPCARGDSQPLGCDKRRALRPRKYLAYTIIEVAVVMLIMSILAAAAVPTFYQSLMHHRLESAARRVKQDLEYLRDTAKATSASLECTFDDDSYTLDESAFDGLDRSGAYTVDLGDPPFEISDLTHDFETDSVGFDGFGNATEGGAIELELGGDTRTIRLVRGTGQVVAEP